MTQAGQVRIAVIGSGKMATVHARNIQFTRGAQLAAIAGGSGALALANEFGVESLDVEEAFGSPSIDAVVIASPNRFHADHIIRAVRGNKAVLVEKPVDLDLERVDQCIGAVGNAIEKVVVAFNRRFDPSFAAARAQILGGDQGSLEQLVIVSRDPAPPPSEYVPSSGGLFRDMMIHDFDMARFLAGDIVSVQATTQEIDRDLAAMGDVSGAIATLRTSAGALVTIVNSRHCAAGYDQRIEAFCSLGTVRVANARPTTLSISNGNGTNAQDLFTLHYADRYQAAYQSEIAHLVAVSQGVEKPKSTLHDGRAALALAVAANESAATGTVVGLGGTVGV